VHGVARWARDCGCHTGGEEGWNQLWRRPLREALNFLRDDAAAKFEQAGSELFADPWAARNDYINVILDPDHAPAHDPRALDLLEMQRSALLMFTSCGWFFSDLAGIETIQVLRYAARVIDLMNKLGLDPPRKEFLVLLAEAKSNQLEKGNGADLFLAI
jgi:alpha-amylase/alpha-mannosidase (GH57 family)